MPTRSKEDYQREIERSRSENDVKLRALLSKSSFAEAAIRGGVVDTNFMAMDEVAISQAARIIRDLTEEPKIRLIALNSLSVAVSTEREVFNLVLRIAGEKSEDVAIRVLAINLLRLTSFGSAFFEESPGNVLDILRGIVQDDSESQNIRLEALEFLAGQLDEFAQRMLFDGLEDEAKAIVDPTRALQMLSADPHSYQPALLQRFAADRSRPEARLVAIKMLARDPKSHPMLIELLHNKLEPTEIRQACAVALRVGSTDEYRNLAQEIVLDESESDELRATALNGLGIEQAASSSRDVNFREAIERLIKESAHEHLQKSAVRYLKNSE